MVKRDDKGIDTTQRRVRDTVGKPVEPGCGPEPGDIVDLHEAHYRPEMGTIVPTNERLNSDNR